MEKTINVEEALKGTPRPYYLIGNVQYIMKENQHELYGKLNFKSNGNPSIEDRVKMYRPHVNLGDCLFAMWNIAHIGAEAVGYKEQIIVDETKMIALKIIPPNTILDIKLIGIEKEKKIDKKGRDYFLGILEGEISRNDELLFKIDTSYFARR